MLPASWGAILLALGMSACANVGLFGRFLTGTFASLAQTPEPPATKLTHPVRPGARLAVLWVGHATVLVQLDDKFILTDPVFTNTVGALSKRFVEPGLDPENLPRIDAVVISHLHFDHLSLGSLDLVGNRMKALILPEGGAVYVPSSDIPPVELRTWQSFEHDGLRITATPVEHVGFRYGGDVSWATTGFTGYVIEYRGQTVYFGGDTARSVWMHHSTGRRFPNIDLAILPIAPIHPREFMCATHTDPAEALTLFAELKAKRMLAIHFDTFFNSLDERGEAPKTLRSLLPGRGLNENDVLILKHGEQRVLDEAPVRIPEAE